METKVMGAAIRHRIIRVLEAKTQMDLWALLVSLDGCSLEAIEVIKEMRDEGKIYEVAVGVYALGPKPKPAAAFKGWVVDGGRNRGQYEDAQGNRLSSRQLSRLI